MSEARRLKGKDGVTITYNGDKLEVWGIAHREIKGTFAFGLGGSPDEAPWFEPQIIYNEAGEDITDTFTGDDLEEISILASEKYN